jgi:hypothetical protein
MKAGASFLCLLWFAAATYGGYRLTAASFAWVDEPNFGLPVRAAKPPAPATSGAAPAQPIDLESLKGQVPDQLMQEAKKLSPRQLLCLRAAVPPAHVQAALQGHLTPEEETAVQDCLK